MCIKIIFFLHKLCLRTRNFKKAMFIYVNAKWIIPTVELMLLLLKHKTYITWSFVKQQYLNNNIYARKYTLYFHCDINAYSNTIVGQTHNIYEPLSIKMLSLPKCNKIKFEYTFLMKTDIILNGTVHRLMIVFQLLIYASLLLATYSFITNIRDA